MGGVSEKVYKRAYDEGYKAWWETNGLPQLTMNPYTKGTRKFKEFNKGWNDAGKMSKPTNGFLQRVNPNRVSVNSE